MGEAQFAQRASLSEGPADRGRENLIDFDRHQAQFLELVRHGSLQEVVQFGSACITKVIEFDENLL